MEKEEKKYAPIAIATLCRYEHFRRCIESLLKCTGAEFTELYIALDYPLKDSHWDGYKKISTYVNTICGFKQIHIIHREKNFGALKNIKELCSLISSKYDRYIFTEDDNEFSPNFLEYINAGLEKYKDDERILAICGYNFPFKNSSMQDYDFNAFPMRSFNSWGYGIWVDKLEEAKKFVDNSKVEGYLHDWQLILKLFKKNMYVEVHRMLQRYKIGACGDLLMRSYIALNDMYCIFPTVSKVRNHGFDGSGINCCINEVYSQQQIDIAEKFVMDSFDIKDYPKVLLYHKSLYERKWIVKRICEFEYILFRLFRINLVSGNFRHFRKKFGIVLKKNKA